MRTRTAIIQAHPKTSDSLEAFFTGTTETFPARIRAYLEHAKRKHVPFDLAWRDALRTVGKPSGWGRECLPVPGDVSSPLCFMRLNMQAAYEGASTEWVRELLDAREMEEESVA